MSRGVYILDDSGNPVEIDDILTWARWLEDAKEKRILAQTRSEGVRVSTVFIGIDYNFGADGPPRLWETVVFAGEHAGYMRRYSSADDARVGHEMAVLIAEGRTTPEAVEDAERSLA